MKKTSATAMLPYEAEDAAVLLGQKIKLARIARGWSQEDLAERSDISRRTITAMEGGAVNTQLGFWLKALWALEILQDFMAGAGSLGTSTQSVALLESNLPKRVRERSSR